MNQFQLLLLQQNQFKFTATFLHFSNPIQTFKHFLHLPCPPHTVVNNSASTRNLFMCKSKMAIRASEPIRRQRSDPRSSTIKSHETNNQPSTSSPKTPLYATTTASNPFSAASSSTSNSSAYRLDTSVGTTSSFSRTSLNSLRDTLPENTLIYDFADIRAATNNFLRNRHSSTSSSSQSWRCTLNNKNAIVFQRKLRRHVTISTIQQKLNIISKSHFTSIIKLLGVSISGEHIYLVYDFVTGSDLSSCLRNKRNPNFTVLSNWASRMQIATDVAAGLDYIHNTAGLSIDLVHKHVKSSGIIITEPSYNAKICHFGAAELCGETATEEDEKKLEGVSGYMSPEFKSSGVATQKSDVYAFGVVLLELMTGEEPVKYSFDRTSGKCERVSVIETAREAVESGGETVEGRLRRWVDKRLKDSFPVEVVERMTRVALQCVEEDPDKRPDMRWVAGKISKMYLASKAWSERYKAPTEISVSLGPR